MLTRMYTFFTLELEISLIQLNKIVLKKADTIWWKHFFLFWKEPLTFHCKEFFKIMFDLQCNRFLQIQLFIVNILSVVVRLAGKSSHITQRTTSIISINFALPKLWNVQDRDRSTCKMFEYPIIWFKNSGTQ